jgi:hypothetical protein
MQKMSAPGRGQRGVYMYRWDGVVVSPNSILYVAQRPTVVFGIASGPQWGLRDDIALLWNFSDLCTHREPLKRPTADDIETVS